MQTKVKKKVKLSFSSTNYGIEVSRCPGNLGERKCTFGISSLLRILNPIQSSVSDFLQAPADPSKTATSSVLSHCTNLHRPKPSSVLSPVRTICQPHQLVQVLLILAFTDLNLELQFQSWRQEKQKLFSHWKAITTLRQNDYFFKVLRKRKPY